jgi:hypothetical protein
MSLQHNYRQCAEVVLRKIATIEIRFKLAWRTTPG